MTRKLALVLAMVALLCATGTVQATATPKTGPALTKHTTTYTTKHSYRTPDGKVVRGIKTGTGQVFVGFDSVTETVDPAPSPNTTDTATSIVWRSLARVADNATWNDPNSNWNYRLGLVASVGQQQTSGAYTWDGPFQFRQLVTCRRFADPGTNGTTLYPTNCALHWYDSALEWRGDLYDLPLAPWGGKNWPGDVGSDFPLYGSWHRAFCDDFTCMHPGDLLQSVTREAAVTFEVPLHVSRTYHACSLLITMTSGTPTPYSDPYGCKGLVAL